MLGHPNLSGFTQYIMQTITKRQRARDGYYTSICVLLPDVIVNRVEPLVDQNDYGVKRYALLTDVTTQSK